MRQCPTPEGGLGQRPLIAHQITGCECVARQQEHYHKCHRCVFRGRSVGLDQPGANGPDRNGAVTGERIVELPSRNGVVAEPAPVPEPQG